MNFDDIKLSDGNFCAIIYEVEMEREERLASWTEQFSNLYKMEILTMAEQT